MKYSEFKIKEVFEKSALKISVVSLSFVVTLFSFILALGFSKDALIIDRGCDSKIALVASDRQTKDEVEAFLREALKLRFDSENAKDASAYLVQDIFIARSKEQEELKSSGVDQKIIIRKISEKSGYFLVNADRLVAVGAARSAIPVSLMVKISSKNRSLTNPYGLVVTSVEQLKDEKKDVN